jgi:hypothetical protein
VLTYKGNGRSLFSLPRSNAALEWLKVGFEKSSVRFSKQRQASLPKNIRLLSMFATCGRFPWKAPTTLIFLENFEIYEVIAKNQESAISITTKYWEFIQLRYSVIYWFTVHLTLHEKYAYGKLVEFLSFRFWKWKSIAVLIYENAELIIFFSCY